MGNIFTDIVEDIEVKPTKSKLLLKWVVRVAVILIAAAFTYGQSKMNRTTRLSTIETSIVSIKTSQEKEFNALNLKIDNIDSRIDKVYDDANKGLLVYQEFNRKQLELIIDYGAENKDMIKRMLEINSMENARRIEANLEKAKNESFTPEINITQINREPKVKDYYSIFHAIKVQSNDTTFMISGATQKFINSINNNNNYIIGEIKSSERYTGRFDFEYKNK